MRLQQGCYGYAVVVRAGNPFSGPGGSWFWRATGREPTETCGRFGRVEYKPLPASDWQIVRGTPAERGTATSWRSRMDLQGPGCAMFY